MDFDEFFTDWRNIRDERSQMDAEFRKLLAEPSAKVPVVGDRVIVAAGLLGRGHLWVRREAIVLEAGDTSYKVQYTDYVCYGDTVTKDWVHQALITDVLGPAQSASVTGIS